jgi:hypothetical protein
MKKIKRNLTHSLIYSARADRWKCKCGYTLGDGHAQLYARCKLAQPEAYHEFKISSAPKAKNHAKNPTKKEQRQTARTGAGISQAEADLFNR